MSDTVNMTIKEQIERFERLQRELAVMGAIGASTDSQIAKELFAELASLDLNINGRPKLKLIKGGAK